MAVSILSYRGTASLTVIGDARLAPEHDPVPDRHADLADLVQQLAELDATFSLTQSTNSEIAHAWYLLALKTGYQEIAAPLERYLINIGRRKLIIPLYKQLASTPEGLAFARAVYEKARPGYHPLAQSTVDELLK